MINIIKRLTSESFCFQVQAEDPVLPVIARRISALQTDENVFTPESEGGS